MGYGSFSLSPWKFSSMGSATFSVAACALACTQIFRPITALVASSRIISIVMYRHFASDAIVADIVRADLPKTSAK